MRDDERYPILNLQSIPDSTPQAVQESYPEAVPPRNSQDKYLVPDPTRTTGGEDIVSANKRATICGLRKANFWVVIAVVVVVIIGAIVGGVVGSLRARENANQNPGLGPGNPKTGPTPAGERAIAVGSTPSLGSTSNISFLQIFYQDLSTTDILYQLAWNDSAKTEQRVSLEMRPNWRTPLAVISSPSDSSTNQSVVVNLFYLSTNLTSNITIVQTTLDCSRGSGTCRAVSSQVISNQFPIGVHTDSKLAAVLLSGSGSTSRFRVYFQAAGGMIWALVGDNPSVNGWSHHMIGGPGVTGGSIAATAKAQAGNLMVVFVWKDNNGIALLRTIEYDDTIGAQGGVTVTDKPGSGFVATSKVATCLQPVGEHYKIFYVGPATGEIVAYYRLGSGGQWKRSQIPEWGLADGGVAVAAWSLEERLLYFTKDRLAFNARHNTVWTNVTYL